MVEFLIANMAPIIFVSMVVFLLVGFPVAFALAANGVVFGLVGRFTAGEIDITEILPSLDRTVYWLTAGYDAGR